MYKNFIFDMGNVLMDFSPDYILSQFTSDINEIQTLKKAIFSGESWALLDQGLITFEEVYQDTIKVLPADLHFTCKRFFNEWHKHKPEIKEMTELVKKLKANEYRIYLCSNAAARFHTYKDQYEVFSYFDDITISADLKISKPDIRIFKYILEKNNLKPKECLFIDDIKKNIVAAEKLNIDGYHFNGNVGLLEKYLNNIGVL